MADRRAARHTQVATMAHPDRLRLLSAVLIADSGGMTDAELVTTTGLDAEDVREHVERMIEVGLLIRDGATLRPSHDALARFGSLAGDGVPRWSGDYGDHDRILRGIVAELTDQFSGTLGPETVREFVFDSYDLLAQRARVRQHLPQLAARFAADRLSAVATVERGGTRERHDVLFICVKNAGRSQIAAALMRSRAGDRIRVRAAGTMPAAELDPGVRDELDRRGVGGFTEFPRPLTSEVIKASGVVVTMGCGDACPVVPGRRYLDWQVDDPLGKPASEVRRIVDEISEHVDALLSELLS